MDIVERLNGVTEGDAYASPWTFGETCKEAAAEITRLRRVVELAVKMRDAQIRCQEADDGETVSTSREAVIAEAAFDAAVKEVEKP